MKTNRFIIYDPEFNNFGHYSRLNKYILELLLKLIKFMKSFILAKIFMIKRH